MVAKGIESDLVLYKRALAGAAQLVALHGDEFLPVFECLEEEVHRIERLAEVRERALDLAKRSS